MKHGHDTYYMRIWPSFTRTLLVIGLWVFLTQVVGGKQASGPTKRSRVSIPEAVKTQTARQIAIKYGAGPFRPSLEMKESADFLLTPAILVQEAISEDIFGTYPTE